MAEPSDEVGLFLRNTNILPSIEEVINSSPDDSLGYLKGVSFVKLNMSRTLDFGSGVGGNNLGMVALGDVS